MDSRKLFQVLVMGGALVGAGCREEEPARPDTGSGDGGPPETDAGSDVVLPTDASVTLPGDDAGEPMECGFCPNDCCVTGEDGTPRAREGFVCCWGTSC